MRSQKARVGFTSILFLIFIIFPGWKWCDLSQADSSYRYLCGYFRYLPYKATAVWGGDNQVFTATYGMIAKGWRKDLHFLDERVFKEADYPKGGGYVYVSGDYIVPPPFRCRPWGLTFRIYSQEAENSPLPPPPPFWMPPHFTRSELNDPEALGLVGDQYFMQAMWYADRGDMAEAHSSLEKSVQAAPRSAYILLKASVQFSNWGDLSTCESLLKKAESIQPQAFSILLNLGVFYGKTGQFGLCQDYLIRAAQVKPNDPTLLKYLTLLNRETQGQLGNR